MRIVSTEDFIESCLCLYGHNQDKLNFINPGPVELFIMIRANERECKRILRIEQDQREKKRWKPLPTFPETEENKS